MGKRLIVAIIASWLVLLVWSAFVPKSQLLDNKEVASSKIETPPPSATIPAATLLPRETAKDALVQITQPKAELTFSETTATLSDVKFKDYQLAKLDLKYGFLLGDGSWEFRKDKSDPDKAVFSYSDQTKKIIKEFNFLSAPYIQELKIIVQNDSKAPLTMDIPLILGVLDLSTPQAQHQGISVATVKGVVNLSPAKETQLQEIKYLAVKDKYFALIVQTAAEHQQGFVKKIDAKLSEVGLIFSTGIIPPGEQFVQSYRIYLGPQELGIINQANPEWAAILSYGSFDFIAQIILKLLQFFYNIVHNWGWTIVILGVVIFVCLLPLTHKQMRSMKAMQALQPKMDALRKMYKDDPQKLNKAMVELWREHKVNPASGCLPLILQLPIILALFQVLSRHIALKGASFLWIKDLAEPDRFLTLPFSLPFLSNEFNLLPILVAVEMFIQQKISLRMSTGNLEQQKMMMILMPIIFGGLFYRMPAGLVLYWFVNSSLMLVYQIKTAAAHA